MCTSAPMQLYFFAPSPPCRAVALVARAAGVRLQLRPVDLLAGEHLSPDYLKINPQHTVPTFVEDDLILSESRAIMGYLVDRHAESDALFPQEPKRRARVCQRLYFDAGTLQQRLVDYMVPVVFGKRAPSAAQWAKVEEGFAFLETFLTGQPWAAGDAITIADYALAVTTSNAEAFGLSLEAYPEVQRWYAAAKEAMDGWDELNQAGADQLGGIVRAAIADAEAANDTAV